MINVKGLNEKSCKELLKMCHNKGPQCVILIRENGEIVVAVVEKGYNKNDYKACSEPVYFEDNIFSAETVNAITKKLKDAYETGGIFKF